MNCILTTMAALQFGLLQEAEWLLIQWVSCTELQGGSTFFLQWDVFKSLSVFSLQVYMGHDAFSGLLMGFAELMGPVNRLFQMDTMMIGTYALCYLFYLFVQPLLDRIGRRMFISHQTEVRLPINVEEFRGTPIVFTL